MNIVFRIIPPWAIALSWFIKNKLISYVLLKLAFSEQETAGDGIIFIDILDPVGFTLFGKQFPVIIELNVAIARAFDPSIWRKPNNGDPIFTKYALIIDESGSNYSIFTDVKGLLDVAYVGNYLERLAS
jgi:hypothetical protein